MIEIKLIVKPDSFTVEVKGHSLFDNKGKDLVCCAVSTLLQSWQLSTQGLLGIEVEAKQDKDSFQAVAQRTDKSQLLFESLSLSLKMLAKQYRKNIKISLEDHNGS